MKKYFYSVFLTLCLVSLNTMPVKATNKFSATSKTQMEKSTSGQWCVWFPWIGGLCWDL